MKNHGPKATAWLLVLILMAGGGLFLPTARAGEPKQAPCPVTTVTSNCYDCHVRGKAWPAVKETDRCRKGR